MTPNRHDLRADTLPDVLTAVEAATYLRLIEDADGHPRDMADAVKSLDHLCEAHGLPSVRIGKARRFVTAAVRDWLVNRSHSPVVIDHETPSTAPPRPPKRTTAAVTS